ncbi:MAG: aldo/keto reductase [Actinobacteria bacterium]|nr:aldo/keto reductase [Actinomycetota bacterium]
MTGAASSAVNLGGRSLTRIGLGTNRLTERAEHVAFVKDAVAAGIELVDTAHVYADGESERTLGTALSEGEDDVLVATKGGYGDGRPDVIASQIEESLRRLQTDAIGLYYLHKVDGDVPIEESVGAIKEQQERGRVRHVGVSNVSLEQLERARKVASIEAVQNHYNLSERGSDDVIDHCAEQGIVFVPYFPLRAGGGAGVREIADRRGATPAQVVLAWLLRRSPTMLPIPGTLSADHVRENLGALALELSEDEVASLR